MEKIVSLAKRRGFIYPGSEIYGGLSGFYDWGHLGVKLRWNIEWAWWQEMVRNRDDIVGISTATILNPRAWEASGHVSGFSDPLSECEKCRKRFRADDSEKKCPECGSEKVTEPKEFNLMFETRIGPAKDSSSVAYLRPETAGGIFVNFKNILSTNRLKIPFGIAQIGLAFRNEISPRDFIFRTREFKQMELEYFVRPNEAEKQFKEWVDHRFKWYKSIGLGNIRKYEHPKKDLAHYSKATTDIEYKFPFGWGEIEGVANRGDFDLKTHSKASNEDLSYFDEETKERFVPYVIEPSAGEERIALALLCDAYTEEKDRTVLRFHPKMAPIKVAVFPLLANKPKLVDLARKIYEDLRKDWSVAWDDRGNIGKRYYSQDEIGTPLCVTVDFESLESNDVTVRDRDTTKQVRVKIEDLKNHILEKLS